MKTLVSYLALAVSPLVVPAAELRGIAAGYPGDTGIERDPRVVFAEDFERRTITDVKQRWSEASDAGGAVLAIAPDSPDGSRGQHALQSTAALGKNTGGHLYKRLDRAAETLHARFYVKFAGDAGFIHHFVTLGGFNPATNWPQGGAGERPRGDDRVTIGIEPHGDSGGITPPGQWSFYNYWHEMKISADGRYWGAAIRPEKPLLVPRGRWQCVEVMVKLNSKPERSDGELALWLDGERVMHIGPGTRHGPWSGMGFRLPKNGGDAFGGFRWRSSPELKLNFFWLLHYVTEAAVARAGVADPPLENRVWFDNIVVATEYVGPIAPVGERAAAPPAKVEATLGAFRSPLLFDDGSRVASAADWPRRRDEILRAWTKELGPWPQVIETPKLETLREETRDGLLWRRVKLEIAPEQTGEGWLLSPAGPGPFPAALVVYYEPETSVGLNPTQPLRDFALQLSKRGFVTLSIGTPGGDARKPDVGHATCQPLSFHAYVAANCWHALASLSTVDRTRIGVVGHSYGGKWALFAAALWDKFAAVAVSDPGIVFDESRSNVNYWEPWYLGLDSSEPRPTPGIPSSENPRTGAYKRLVAAGRDLHELHALIAPRPFHVSGGAEDPPERWAALDPLVEINRLLGAHGRVSMTNRKDHNPNDASNAEIYAFFERVLGNR